MLAGAIEIQHRDTRQWGNCQINELTPVRVSPIQSAGRNHDRAMELMVNKPRTGRPMSPKVSLSDSNPKIDPDPASNTEEDPDDWVSGDDAMTGAQASYLKTLSEQAHEPDAFDDRLTKAQASKRIDALKAKMARPRKTKA
jgi:Protein of unknown function (DUF3072)